MGQPFESARSYFEGGAQTQVIIDTTWGDGGKGKTVDSAAPYFDAVVRYQGGGNAGHRVMRGATAYDFHLLPSSTLHPDTLSVIAAGVVVNPSSLAKEITQVRNMQVQVSPDNLLVDNKAHLVMPWHKIRDGLAETAREGEKIGTTNTGNGPAYSDRALRVGLRVGDLVDEQKLKNRFDQELLRQEALIQGMTKAGETTIELDRDAILTQLLEAREVVLPLIGNAQGVLWRLEDEGKRIMGEGAQGALLDLDLGGYPYVTSSHPGRAGLEIATALRADEVHGVTKAYATRVGEGPMPTELFDEIGEYLQKTGREVGVTTRRKRRCGWFDAVAARYGKRVGGVTGLVVTKLDILDGLPEVKLGVGYEIDGKQYSEIDTADPEMMRKAKPIYETLPGWDKTAGIKSFDDLPVNAQKYLGRIEELVGLKIDIVSVGPQPEDAIYRRRAA